MYFMIIVVDASVVRLVLNKSLNEIRRVKQKQSTYRAQLRQMYLQRLRVVLQPERGHRMQDILAPHRLALLQLAALRGLGGDEGDELADALLHALLRVFSDLGGGGHGCFHNAGDVGDLRTRSG